MLNGLALAGGLAIAVAAFPAMAQQDHDHGPGDMMGQGGMMGQSGGSPGGHDGSERRHDGQHAAA